MIDNSETAVDSSRMETELDEVDIEALQDAQFHLELTDYVATLPVATNEQLTAYEEKMRLLDSIRSEVFPAPVEPEWDHSEMYDSKYHYEYSVGTH